MHNLFHVFVAFYATLGEGRAKRIRQEGAQFPQRARLVISNSSRLLLALSEGECRSRYRQQYYE